jgi:hypothetical protein
MRTTAAVLVTFSAGRVREWIGLAAVLGSTAMASATQAAEVTYQRLLNPEPHNWLMVLAITPHSGIRRSTRSTSRTSKT